jgi:hypothetical protein
MNPSPVITSNNFLNTLETLEVTRITIYLWIHSWTRILRFYRVSHSVLGASVVRGRARIVEGPVGVAERATHIYVNSCFVDETWANIHRLQHLLIDVFSSHQCTLWEVPAHERKNRLFLTGKYSLKLVHATKCVLNFPPIVQYFFCFCTCVRSIAMSPIKSIVVLLSIQRGQTTFSTFQVLF